MCDVHFQVLTARNLSLLPCFWSSFLSLFSGTKPNQFRQFYVRFKSTLSPGRSQLTRFTSHIVSLSLPPPLSSFPLSSTPPSSLPLSSPPLSSPPLSPLLPSPSFLPQLFNSVHHMDNSVEIYNILIFLHHTVLTTDETVFTVYTIYNN